MVPFDDLHHPVLVQEVLDNLRFVTGRPVFADSTVGIGGHSEAVLRRFPNASIVGIDVDREALAFCQRRLSPYGDRVHLIQGSYTDFSELLERAGFGTADTVLIDTGVSSYDIDTPERGFSFAHNGPLDMRYDRDATRLTAADVVNREDQRTLRSILVQNGEVPFAGRIASAIVAARKTKRLETTGELADLVKRAVGGRIHPGKSEGILARVFQSIRYVVNQELKTLELGLNAAIGALARGGRLLVICYESISHGLVKRVFRTHERGCICPSSAPMCTCGRKPTVRIVTRRSIGASEEEIRDNSRSRSARLRAVERL